MLRAKSNKTNNQLSSLKNSYWRKISRNWVLYLFLLPTFAYIIAFCYVPMYGIQIAFKDFSISKGFWDSPWVGLKWFEKFFGSPKFFSLLKNTLTLSIYNLIVGFPLPIIMAVMLHNLRNEKWKKFAQTITYMPHFISTVILVSIISIMFSPRTGIINTILGYLGGSGTTYFMGNASYFPHLYTWSGIWQETGWGTIIYLAALSGVDPSLHEAAEIDGASKLQRIYHIDIPSIIPTIIIMLILRCGSIMGVGYVWLIRINLKPSEGLHGEYILGGVVMICFNRKTLEDKIYACWVGKNIGGTMGTPYEGKKQINDIQGFSTPKDIVLPIS